jgi:hypothetical protein
MLKGRNGNNASLVMVSSGARLTMKHGSKITGNNTDSSGGGVRLSSSVTNYFFKNPGNGVITGYTSDPVNSNMGRNNSPGGDGHAVFMNSGLKRERTVTAEQTLRWNGAPPSIGDWSEL